MLVSIIGISLLSLVLSGTASGAGGQSEDSSDIARATAFRSMSFLVGTWTCHSLVRGLDRRDIVSYALESNGRWMHVHSVSPPVGVRQLTIIADGDFTYDVARHHWFRTDRDSRGGYDVRTSSSWTGSTLVWSDILTDDGSLDQDRFTKIAQDQTRDVFVFQSRPTRTVIRNCHRK